MIDRVDAVPYQKLEGRLPAAAGELRFTGRVPDERSIGKTVLALSGMWAGESSLSPYAKLLAQAGVVTVTAAPRVSAGDDAAREVRAVKEHLEDTFQQPVVLAGHSRGGIVAVQAALLSPDSSELLLLQPAGFGGVHPLRLAHSLVAGRPDNSHVGHEVKLMRDGFRYGWTGKQRLGRVVRSALSMDGRDSAELLPGDMIKNAIEFPGDSLVDGRESRVHLEAAGFTVHSLRVAQAGHNAQTYHSHEVADLTTLIIGGYLPDSVDDSNWPAAS